MAGFSWQSLICLFHCMIILFFTKSSSLLFAMVKYKVWNIWVKNGLKYFVFILKNCRNRNDETMIETTSPHIAWQNLHYQQICYKIYLKTLEPFSNLVEPLDHWTIYLDHMLWMLGPQISRVTRKLAKQTSKDHE